MAARSGRQPHLLALLVASVLVGLGGFLLGPHVSNAVDLSFGDARYGWYGGLSLAALVALGGIAKGGLDGLLIERGALVGLTGVCLAYAVGAVMLSGPRGLVPAVIVAAYGVANIVRVVQISRDLAWIKRLFANSESQR